MTEADEAAGDRRPGARRPGPEGWPVLHEQPLFPAERRFLRRYRNLALLPPLKPGSVYVFAARGRYAKYDDAASLRADDPVLIDANSMSIVATRFRRIRVFVNLSTSEVATDLPVVVTFGCDVTDPREVARIGLNDLRGELESRVRHERSLTNLRHHISVDDIGAARNMICDALDDTYRTAPPLIHGIKIIYEGAQVKLSPELLRHLSQVRDVKWLEREHQIKHAVERRRVRDVERDLLSSAERSEATAVTREERTAAQTAARQFEERDTQTERLMAHVRDWLGSDAAKRAPVDRRQLVEALFARLINERVPIPDLARLTGIVELPPSSNGHADFDIGHIAPEEDSTG